MALGIPEHEAKVYAEGIKRGNLIVAVRAPEDRLPVAESVFKASNAVDINSRRQEWEEDIVPLSSITEQGGPQIPAQ